MAPIGVQAVDRTQSFSARPSLEQKASARLCQHGTVNLFGNIERRDGVKLPEECSAQSNSLPLSRSPGLPALLQTSPRLGLSQKSRTYGTLDRLDQQGGWVFAPRRARVLRVAQVVHRSLTREGFLSAPLDGGSKHCKAFTHPDSYSDLVKSSHSRSDLIFYRRV